MKKHLFLSLILVTGLMHGAETSKKMTVCSMSVPSFCAAAGAVGGGALCLDAEIVTHCCPKPYEGTDVAGIDTMLNRAFYAAGYAGMKDFAEKAPSVGLLCCALPFAFWLGREGCDQITDCCKECCKDSHKKEY